jgi:hypothetical protein
VAISHGCRGVAARACGLVNLEPTKVSVVAIWVHGFGIFMLPQYSLSVCFLKHLFWVIASLSTSHLVFFVCKWLETYYLHPKI